ncbi:hypothetical protein [Blastococcus sp. SYSU DS1024]
MSAATGLDILEPEGEPAIPQPSRRPRWALTIASGAALLAGLVLAALVWSPGWGEAAPRRAPGVPVVRAPAPVENTPEPDGIRSALPEFPGATLGEAVPVLEAAGARAVTFDARWDRAVAPDWRICTQTATTRGDGRPTGDVHLAAVPPGDPCV